MQSTICDLRDKDVVNVRDGCCLGRVCDVMFDMEDGKLTALVVPGTSRAFGLLGRGEDIIIPWDKIEKMGCDTILVCLEPRCRDQRLRGRARG